MNSDTDLKLVPSKRVAAFVRAVRKKWRCWNQQLGAKMREAVHREGMPSEIYNKNGQPILEEEFADNAFAYASIQLMRPGARDDGWHTDGGCSLLHASVTIFGTRSVEVKVEGRPPVTLKQEPGSFYVGNFAALEHNVRHHPDCKQTFDFGGAAARAEAANVCAKGKGKKMVGCKSRTRRGASDRRPDPLRRVSGFQGTQDKLHSRPYGALPRRELRRGPALGQCTCGAP